MEACKEDEQRKELGHMTYCKEDDQRKACTEVFKPNGLDIVPWHPVVGLIHFRFTPNRWIGWQKKLRRGQL